MASSSTDVFSKETLEIEALQRKRVIVRIWTSLANINKPGKNVGHVSIECPGVLVNTPNTRATPLYLSFWPDDKSASLGVKAPIPHENKLNYQEDFEAENRPPEYMFCFYTLDIDRIRDAFEKHCATAVGWSLTGLIKLGGGDSCASSAWKLLIAGGIGELVSKLERASIASVASAQGSLLFSATPAIGSAKGSKGSVYGSEMAVSSLIESPDFVGTILEQAKGKELKRVPLTSHERLKFQGETLPTPTKHRRCGCCRCNQCRCAKPKRCIIM
jgi:hypothetical protein